MLFHTVRLATFALVLAASSTAQSTVTLPMNLVARTDVDPQERRVVFHLRDAAKSPEFITALVRLMDPKRDATAVNPLRAHVWPPRISTPAPDEVVVELDARVPGLARLFAQGPTPVDTHDSSSR
jgi:hypothetical protein